MINRGRRKKEEGERSSPSREDNGKKGGRVGRFWKREKRKGRKDERKGRDGWRKGKEDEGTKEKGGKEGRVRRVARSAQCSTRCSFRVELLTI